MRRVVLVAGFVLVGCATLPIRSTTGHRIKRIMISESLALRTHQPAQVELSGAELAPAVDLLDRNDVLRLHQFHFSSDATDGSSVVLVVETTKDSYSIELDNCPEPHVCGFLRDATAAGLVDHLPETCTKRGLMCGGTCNLDCEKVAPSQPLPTECEGLIDPSQCSDYLACRPVIASDGGTTTKVGCAVRIRK